MKLKHSFLSLVSLVMLLGLAGCAHYRAKPLAKLRVNQSQATHAETIAMAYQVFNKKDCMKYLDRNVLKKGYQPIHLAIDNNTNRSLSFSLKDIELPCAFAEDVAEKVRTNTAARVVGYTTAGLVGYPLAVISSGGMAYTALGLGVSACASAFIFPIAAVLVIGAPAFLISAIVDGNGSAKANKLMYGDFARKSLEDQTINPYSRINGLIFVPVEDFNSNNLTISLFDNQNGEQFVLSLQNPRLQIVKETESFKAIL